MSWEKSIHHVFEKQHDTVLFATHLPTGAHQLLSRGKDGQFNYIKMVARERGFRGGRPKLYTKKSLQMAARDKAQDGENINLHA